MATLSTLLSKLNLVLDTYQLTNFSEDKRISALTEARKRIIMRTELQELFTEEDLAFISGVASLSTLTATFWEAIKLWNDDDNGTNDSGYLLVDQKRFDHNEAKTYKIQGGNVYIYPADTDTLKFRFIKLPDDFDSNSQSADSGLPQQLDESHVYMAAYILFKRNRKDEQAEMVKRELNDIFDDAYAAVERNYGARNESSGEVSMYSVTEEESYLPRL